MIAAKFPSRKVDGSFCVEVGLQLLEGTPDDICDLIDQWFSNGWMSENKTWTRTWLTGANFETKRNEVLVYSDEFLSAPEVSLGGKSELQIQLLGTKSSKFWKDWLVSKIAPDLKEKFPYIGELLYIRDCID
jgi:hypothetical protein